jgi:hypothetical protein
MPFILTYPVPMLRLAYPQPGQYQEPQQPGIRVIGIPQ